MAIFVEELKKAGFLDTLTITMAQVGSRKVEASDDFGSQDWRLFAPNLKIYGFDADPEACDIANAYLSQQNIDWQEVHIPLALGALNQEKTLYVTNDLRFTSLYPPNQRLFNRFAWISGLAELSYSVEIETATLDDFCESEGIDQIDFLQIDVQGADLDILKGAKGILSKSGLGIQIEVEFSSLYQEQPLFTDVDIHLREIGFSLFGLDSCHWPRSVFSWDIHYGRKQLVWSDAIYFRDLISHDYKASLAPTPLSIFKLACIADILGFTDYALELFIYIIQNTDAEAYYCPHVLLGCLERLANKHGHDPEKIPAVNILKQYV